MNVAVQEASSTVNFPPRLLRAGKSDIQGDTTSRRWPGFSSSNRNKPSRHSVMSRVGEAADLWMSRVLIAVLHGATAISSRGRSPWRFPPVGDEHAAN